jgi:hypothetical protein
MSNGEEHSGVLGHFDKWICAASYIMTHFTADKRADLMQALCIVEAHYSGKRKRCIAACIPKTKLKEYCGNNGMTRAERDLLNEQLEAETAL